MKTISVLSQKGGSGKTTLALHLAVATQQAGKTVVISDLDPQASATMWHKRREDPMPHVQPTHPAALSDLLPELERQGVDLLIIDTPPQSDKPATEAAEAADLIIMVCSPSILDLMAMQNTIRLIQLANLKPHTKAVLTLTKIDPFGSTDKEAASALRKLGVTVLPCGLGNRVAYRHGLNDGRTALEYEPNGKAAQEVRNLYKQIYRQNGMKVRHHEVNQPVRRRKNYEQEIRA